MSDIRIILQSAADAATKPVSMRAMAAGMIEGLARQASGLSMFYAAKALRTLHPRRARMRTRPARYRRPRASKAMRAAHLFTASAIMGAASLPLRACAATLRAIRGPA